MRAAKVDANHRKIVQALRDVGATVLDLAKVGNGAPDLLVGFRGNNFLIEVKDGSAPPSARKLRPNQVEFHGGWKGNTPAVALSVDDALAAIGAKVRPATGGH